VNSLRGPSRRVVIAFFLAIAAWRDEAVGGQLSLTWVNNATNEAGFSIERSSGTTEAFAELTSTPAGVTTYTDSGLADGAATYCYRVRAFNAAGYSGYSNVACGVPREGGGPVKTFTVPPCRVLDTRLSSPRGPIQAGETQSILVTGDLTGGGTVNQGGATICGVPNTATAVFANVVAVNAAGPGHLIVYPFGTPLPLASTLNLTTGQTVANGVLIPICPSGAAWCPFNLSITMGPAAADLVVDVSGYLAPRP
jgi:hypothetical protein